LGAVGFIDNKIVDGNIQPQGRWNKMTTWAPTAVLSFRFTESARAVSLTRHPDRADPQDVERAIEAIVAPYSGEPNPASTAGAEPAVTPTAPSAPEVHPNAITVTLGQLSCSSSRDQVQCPQFAGQAQSDIPVLLHGKQCLSGQSSARSVINSFGIYALGARAEIGPDKRE
jgi:hypothetical protein